MILLFTRRVKDEEAEREEIRRYVRQAIEEEIIRIEQRRGNRWA